MENIIENEVMENEVVEVKEEKPVILRKSDERVNIRTSESLTKLLPALVKFHSELDTIEKSSANPFFKSSYATIDSIIEYVKPILAKQGLLIYQSIIDGGQDMLSIKTILFHESGEFIESDSVPVPMIGIEERDGKVKKDKFNIQSAMGSVTYMRRYTLNSILNLAFSDEDLDGNDVQGTKPAEASRPQATVSEDGSSRRRSRR